MATQPKRKVKAKNAINPILEKRLKLLKDVVSDQVLDKEMEKKFIESKGNLLVIKNELDKERKAKDKKEEDQLKLKIIELSNELAEITVDNTSMVKNLLED